MKIDITRRERPEPLYGGNPCCWGDGIYVAGDVTIVVHDRQAWVNVPSESERWCFTDVCRKKVFVKIPGEAVIYPNPITVVSEPQGK